MATTEKDLWGPMSLDYSGETPLKLMESQARLLEIKTQNLLRGEIFKEEEEGLIHYIFYIIAPKLNDYRYSVLRVTMGDLPFPALVYDYTERSDKISLKTDHIRVNGMKILVPGADYSVSSIGEFEIVFANILSSKDMRGVINSLIAQSVSSTKT